MEIEKNISLAKFTTLQVGGVADFFARVCSTEELKKALEFARKKKLPVFIFGGGSNLLFSDAGFRGLVIKNEIGGVEFKKNSVVAGGGVPLAVIVAECARRGLKNLENFAGIPGTVGGAVIGNANGIGDKILRIRVLNADGETVILSREDLEFNYRQSALQDAKSFLVEAEFTLEKTEEDLQQKVAELAREKFTKHPFEKTAGSWFKNPEGKQAWKLIDAAGCRGLQIGGARVSNRHANFFENADGATSSDFLELEKKVVEKVFKKFGVRLEREVIVVFEN
ncbi:MAG: UDP-N-acetylmuramate dehydrogenase [Patescibacteria group bacterium]